MGQHTPGPWQLVRDDGYYIEPVGAHISGHSETYEEDANLIAAAPDMLAALKRILPYCMELREDEPTPLYEHYHASKAVYMAIAKAEGRS